MTQTTFHIPTLETERLTLRAPGPQDVEPFAAFFATEASAPIGGPIDTAETWRMLAGIAGHWMLRGYGRWMVTWKGQDTAIGLVGLHHPEDWPEAEVGWSVWGDGLGKGVAQEAARAARTNAYETHGLDRLISSCAPDNPRSALVAERLGAVRDGEWTHSEYGPFNIWRHPSEAQT
ncbi:GNAT family N-acetyltransferase [Jannaschia sp. CCS1]|uniref:GNAT family N-acetyltransferase n=1 Tax=Jannaschia sp. (strain CCS1) TaxID=290400 RepID=UPI000053ABE0|nr:GNAT family N-acetyltransferase [Jannaschia sp. CCS1]ABD53672.1 acetyltransferase GNAT family [Jannaschia sp. CCS1]